MINISPMLLMRSCAAGLWFTLANTAFAAGGNIAEAAQRGDLATVETLLRSGDAPVDAPSRYGMTALLWATQANELDMVRSLLEAGADANLGNLYGITPLWLAATNRSPAMLELLLESGADVNLALPHGETALMAAARAGDAESIDVLLAAGADPNASESSQGETALMWAAAENHPEAIRRLIKGGADPDQHSLPLSLAPMEWVQVGMVSTTLPVGSWTAVMYAARQDSLEAVITLAEQGANLNEQDQDGTTALNFAIMNQHYDLAAALLEAGADPNIPDRTGMSSLYGAVHMVSHKRDTGRPPMPVFDKLKALDLVRLTLAHGADPNARLVTPVIGRHHDFADRELGNGATALMRAIKGNDLESMRLLLEAGADPLLKLEDSGMTSFDLALGKGRTATVQFGGSGKAAPNEAALKVLEEFSRPQ